MGAPPISGGSGIAPPPVPTIGITIISFRNKT